MLFHFEVLCWFLRKKLLKLKVTRKGQGEWMLNALYMSYTTRSDLEMTSCVLWSWMLSFTSRNNPAELSSLRAGVWIIVHLYPRTSNHTDIRVIKYTVNAWDEQAQCLRNTVNREGQKWLNRMTDSNEKKHILHIIQMERGLRC